VKDLFALIRERLLENESMVLVTVLESSGSAPRGAGAKMLVGKSEGKAGLLLWGSIGGGLPEYHAIEEATALLQTLEERCIPAAFSKKCQLKAEAGAICGGEVLLFFRSLNVNEPGLFEVIEKALACFTDDKAAWFIMGKLALGIAWKDGFLFSKGTGPQNLITFLLSTPVLFEEDQIFWFSEPLLSSSFVYIFGGGHIALELVPLLARLGFRCIIFDDREEFIQTEVFPQAEKLILGNFKQIEEHLNLSEKDYAVIITHEHIWDLEVLCFALASPALYIGVIGSKAKHELVREKLKERFFEDAVINAPRVHAPIGLKIKSKTPLEIAVSIAAELILVRAQEASASR
jgi:xanthine dehydrogenase accessory factor